MGLKGSVVVLDPIDFHKKVNILQNIVFYVPKKKEEEKKEISHTGFEHLEGI